VDINVLEGVLFGGDHCCWLVIVCSSPKSDGSVSKRGWSYAQFSQLDGRRRRKILSEGLRWLDGVNGMDMLDGVSTSFSRDGTELTEMEGTEHESVSLSQSLEANDFSDSSNGVRRTSRGVPVNVISSNPLRSNLLKSFPRGEFRDSSRAAQLCLGTGISVAFSKVLSDDD
jgi:hypothetical protein